MKCVSNYPQYPNTPGSGSAPQSGGNSPYASGAHSPSQNYGSSGQPYGSQPAQQPYGSQPVGSPAQQPYGSQPAGGAGQQPAYGNSYANQGMGGGMPAGFGQPGPDGTVPLNQPHYGASIKEATMRFFKKYVRFNGFASRSEFWWPVLSIFIIQLILMIPYIIGLVMMSAGSVAAASSYSSTGTAGGGGAATFGTILVFLSCGLLFLFGLAIIVPSIAVTVRRLHDAGFSGWWYLLSLAPGGGLVVLIFCALESKPEKWQPEWYDQAA